MSVIGKLDGQVDEVLIKPLVKNRSEGNEHSPHPAASKLPTPAEPEKPEKPVEREELPVWLL